MTRPIPPGWTACTTTARWCPSMAEHFARWAEQSAQAARSASRASWTCAYGDGAGETLDIFPGPRSAGSRGAGAGVHPRRLLARAGQVATIPSSRRRSRRRGACVVMPNYALCPAVTIPEITMQMVQALAWTWRNIARYGGDPQRITVVGPFGRRPPGRDAAGLPVARVCAAICRPTW